MQSSSILAQTITTTRERRRFELEDHRDGSATLWVHLGDHDRRALATRSKTGSVTLNHAAAAELGIDAKAVLADAMKQAAAADGRPTNRAARRRAMREATRSAR